MVARLPDDLRGQLEEALLNATGTTSLEACRVQAPEETRERLMAAILRKVA